MLKRTMNKTNVIQKLDSHHESMIIKEVYEGATVGALAHEFGLNESYVAQLRQSECWKTRRQELQNELREVHLSEITSLRGEAIGAYRDAVRDTSNPALRVKTAGEILSRTGFSAGVDLNVKGSPIFNMIIPKHLQDGEEEIIDVTPEENETDEQK